MPVGIIVSHYKNNKLLPYQPLTFESINSSVPALELTSEVELNYRNIMDSIL
jgi:hypothetical protein